MSDLATDARRAQSPYLRITARGDYIILSVIGPREGECTEAVIEVSRGIEVIDWWMLGKDRLAHSDDVTGSHLTLTKRGEVFDVQVLYGLDHSASETVTVELDQVPVIMWGLHAGEVLDREGAEIRWAWFMHDYPNN